MQNIFDPRTVIEGEGVFSLEQSKSRRLRMLSIGFAVALCLLPLMAFAADGQQEISERAWQHLETHGVAREAVSLHQAHYFAREGFWRCSFLMKEQPEETDGLYLVDMHPDGSLKELHEPLTMPVQQRIQRGLWDLLPLPYTTEGLMKLRAKWSPVLADVIAEEAQRGGNPESNVAFVNARALSQDIRMPDSDALGPVEAQARAEQHILATAPWTSERLDQYECYLAAHYGSRELGKPVWHFIYSMQSVLRTTRFVGRDWKAYERSYLKPLYALFGGELDAPLYVSVRIDAVNGGLIGGVHTEYIPIKVPELAHMR